MGAGCFGFSGDVMVSVTEIILIIVGILAVILGYLIPNGTSLREGDVELTEQRISEMVKKAVQNSQGQIDDMLDECMEDAINKAERAMDRVTNEKMSAISEYSDTVMNDIHRNHDEVMFMYDMLNDKHKNLKNTVSEVNRAAKEVKQTAEEAVLTAEQAEAAARSAREAAKKAEIAENVQRYEYVNEAASQERHVVMPEPQTVMPQPQVITPQQPVISQPQVFTPQQSVASHSQIVVPESQFIAQESHVVSPEPQSVSQDQRIVVPEPQEDVQTSNEEFMSLTDILDRADAAAAEKTSGRIIGSEPEYTDLLDDSQTQMPVAEENYEYFDEDEIEEEPHDSLVDNNIVEEPAYMESEDSDDESGNNVSAKVVSIADAPRKKLPEKENSLEQRVTNMAEKNEGLSDPASRNQRILDMHKAGKSAVVIARELRLGIGEVKLVIDLAGKHKKNRSSII